MFALIEETSKDVYCEWEYWKDGYICDKLIEFALVDGNKFEPDYPEGFHEGHFCAEHAQKALELVSDGLSSR